MKWVNLIHLNIHVLNVQTCAAARMHVHSRVVRRFHGLNKILCTAAVAHHLHFHMLRFGVRDYTTKIVSIIMLTSNCCCSKMLRIRSHSIGALEMVCDMHCKWDINFQMPDEFIALFHHRMVHTPRAHTCTKDTSTHARNLNNKFQHFIIWNLEFSAWGQIFNFHRLKNSMNVEMKKCEVHSRVYSFCEWISHYFALSRSLSLLCIWIWIFNSV